MHRKIIDHLVSKDLLHTDIKNHVYLQGRRFNKVTAFRDHLMAETDLLCECVEMPSLEYVDKKHIKEWATNVFHTAKTTAPKLAKTVNSEGEEVGLIDEFLEVHNLRILVDYAKSHRQIVFNMERKAISPVSVESLKSVLDKDELPPATLADLVYDPYDIVPYKATGNLEGLNLLSVNLYSPPKWRYGTVSCPDIPERIETFLRHVFKGEESFQYVLAWLRTAILYRNDVVMVMNGAKGTGKGVFSNLLQALAGQEHFAVAPKSLMLNQFNAVLENNRAIYLDEFKINRENHASVKRITNALQSVEKKGQDAFDVETYNSFLISNNDASDMRIEHDDRRFSVMELSNLPLVKEKATPQGLWSRDDIAQFEEDMKDPECQDIVDFGHWLIDRLSDELVDPNIPFRGETFHSLVFAHLEAWKQTTITYIYDMVEEGAFDLEDPDSLEVLVEDIRKEFNTTHNKTKLKYPTKESGLHSFLRSYVHRDIGKIGKLGKDKSGDEVIKLDQYFISEIMKLNELAVDEEGQETYIEGDGSEDL